MAHEFALRDVAAGRAALSLCESLLLALRDNGALSDQDFKDVIGDVAETHRNAGPDSDSPELQAEVVDLMNAIVEGRNSLS
jgi:hypothetical protein